MTSKDMSAEFCCLLYNSYAAILKQNSRNCTFSQQTMFVSPKAFRQSALMAHKILFLVNIY